VFGSVTEGEEWKSLWSELWRDRRTEKPPMWPAFAMSLFLLSAAVWLDFERSRDLSSAARQQTTLGVLVGFELPEHGQYKYDYSFVLRGENYKGLDYISDLGFDTGTPDGRSRNVHSVVVVHYDPATPDKNSLHDLSEMASNDGFGVIVLLIFSGLSPVMVYLDRKYWFSHVAGR
jgi:hypothetical protein